MIMPDPRRVARHSVALCRKAGMTDLEARATVARAAAAAQRRCERASHHAAGWLLEIRAEVFLGARRPPSPGQDRKE